MNRGNRGGGWQSVSRGRSPQSAGRYFARESSAGRGYPEDTSSGQGIGSSTTGKNNSEIASIDGVTRKINDLSSSDYSNGPNFGPCGVGNISQNDGLGNSKLVQNGNEAEDQKPKQLECQFPQEVEHGNSASEGTMVKGELENSDSQQKGFSFDICEERSRGVVKLKLSLLDKNKATRNEKRHMQGDKIQIYRPGMILLKSYLSVADQVKLVKSCRDLGRGSGGFYQPGYRDGAKLHLKMMCLGKNWDPETSMYGEKRPVDEAKPPPIPDEFQLLVKRAIQDCHSYLESQSKLRNARDILPSMSPNICIINFYTKTGRLGLHQDKDESQESLHKRLPVVSFSLGDSAEFLFGDQRDVDKADKLELKSGDVLIFGGESRHIFHGVSAIIPDTAPKPLLEETGLRPGRLNLTFREY